MTYSNPSMSSSVQSKGTVLNQPKTFFYPIGWVAIACVGAWFVWMAIG